VEWLWGLIAEIQMFPNGFFQCLDTVYGTAAQTLCFTSTKHAFYGIQPRAAGGRVVDVESRVLAQPLAHRGVFVGQVVIYDEMNLHGGVAAETFTRPLPDAHSSLRTEWSSHDACDLSYARPRLSREGEGAVNHLGTRKLG
jgi:hypothetical protein